MLLAHLGETRAAAAINDAVDAALGMLQAEQRRMLVVILDAVIFGSLHIHRKSIMTQTAIPFLFMRGGSSRGPYMNKRLQDSGPVIL